MLSVRSRDAGAICKINETRRNINATRMLLRSPDRNLVKESSDLRWSFAQKGRVIPDLPVKTDEIMARRRQIIALFRCHSSTSSARPFSLSLSLSLRRQPIDSRCANRPRSTPSENLIGRRKKKRSVRDDLEVNPVSSILLLSPSICGRKWRERREEDYINLLCR